MPNGGGGEDRSKKLDLHPLFLVSPVKARRHSAVICGHLVNRLLSASGRETSSKFEAHYSFPVSLAPSDVHRVHPANQAQNFEQSFRT